MVVYISNFYYNRDYVYGAMSLNKSSSALLLMIFVCGAVSFCRYLLPITLLSSCVTTAALPIETSVTFLTWSLWFVLLPLLFPASISIELTTGCKVVLLITWIGIRGILAKLQAAYVGKSVSIATYSHARCCSYVSVDVVLLFSTRKTKDRIFKWRLPIFINAVKPYCFKILCDVLITISFKQITICSAVTFLISIIYWSYSPMAHMAVSSNALRVSWKASNGVDASSHKTVRARDCTYAGCRDNTAINFVAKLIGAACLATLSSCRETSTRHS